MTFASVGTPEFGRLYRSLPAATRETARKSLSALAAGGFSSLTALQESGWKPVVDPGQHPLPRHRTVRGNPVCMELDRCSRRVRPAHLKRGASHPHRRLRCPNTTPLCGVSASPTTSVLLAIFEHFDLFPSGRLCKHRPGRARAEPRNGVVLQRFPKGWIPWTGTRRRAPLDPGRGRGVRGTTAHARPKPDQQNRQAPSS